MEQWEQCDESELEEFAAIRKGETQSGQHVLGGPEPTFWAYPDTGIGTVWTAFSTGTGIDTKLRRSDCTKDGVFGKGSQIDATPRTLYNQLYSQQGFLSRTGTIPIGMGGLVDCNGYQMGFIRSNEMFLLEPH